MNVIHVPKNTWIWRIPKPFVARWWDKQWKYIIDPSQLENTEFEDVQLTTDDDGIRRGYSKYLHCWIIADEEANENEQKS